MHFIYDILYSDAYPFDTVSDTVSKGIIKDIVILNAESAWLTDIIITSDRAFIAFVDNYNTVITADIESPVMDTPYALTDAFGNRGSIVFGELLSYAVNIGAEHLQVAPGICLPKVNNTTENIYGDTRNRYDIIFTGSLVGSYDKENAKVIIAVDESIFINEPTPKFSGMNIEGNGVRSIAGVTADSNKNIEINIPGAGFEPVVHNGEVIGLKLVTVSIPGCDATDVITDNITCSIEDGSATNYPLDDIICNEDTPICPEEWEK